MLTPYLLAGGKSLRMGQDKAFLHLGSQTLLEQALDRLRTFGNPLILSGNPANLDRTARLAQHAPTVPDRTPDSGPLAGIDAALHHSPTEWVLVLPVDQPDLPIAALARLVQAAGPGILAAWFTHPGGTEPLPLLLHRSLAGPVSAALQRGDRKIVPTIRALAAARLREIFQAESDWFANLNHPADVVENVSPQVVSIPPAT